MELYIVYDAKGEMFEVPAATARTLIVDLGWTPVPPEKFKQPFEDAKFVTAAEIEKGP